MRRLRAVIPLAMAVVLCAGCGTSATGETVGSVGGAATPTGGSAASAQQVPKWFYSTAPVTASTIASKLSQAGVKLRVVQNALGFEAGTRGSEQTQGALMIRHIAAGKNQAMTEPQLLAAMLEVDGRACPGPGPIATVLAGYPDHTFVTYSPEVNDANPEQGPCTRAKRDLTGLIRRVLGSMTPAASIHRYRRHVLRANVETTKVN